MTVSRWAHNIRVFRSGMYPELIEMMLFLSLICLMSAWVRKSDTCRLTISS